MKTIAAVITYCLLSALSLSQNNEWITFSKLNSPIESNFILSTVFDRANNTIWVGTFGLPSYGLGGVVRIPVATFSDTNTWTLFNTSNSSIGNNLSWTIVIDSLGNKWVNCGLANLPTFTPSRLSKFSKQNTWTTFSYPAFWASAVNSVDIAADKFNNIWIAVASSGSPGGGTILGRVGMFNGTNFILPNVQLTSRNVRTVAIDKNNIKWFGTNVDASGYGIMRYNDTITTIFDGNNIPPLNGSPFNVKTIKVSPTNEKWIGTELGLLRYNDIQWTLYNESNSGIPSNFIQSIAFEGNTIWIGTLNGLAKFDGNNNWEVFDTTNSAIPGGVVEAISVDNLGNKWMGTRDFQNPYGLTVLKESVIGITATSNIIPEGFKLYNNYPNPFNPSTKIKFDIPKSGNSNNIKLMIYDVSGKNVSIIVNQALSSGTYEVLWDAGSYPSGIYFYRLESGSVGITKKMILIK